MSFYKKYNVFNHLDNACINNPCLNGGTCQTQGNQYICFCAQYYSGATCQFCKINIRFLIPIAFINKIFLDSNACSSGPCLNGGYLLKN
jgi:hypothetical protein